MTTYLTPLLEGARRRVAVARAAEPLEALRERASAVAPGPSLVDALAVPGVALIAEVKRASPSRGPLAPDADALALARAYRAGGAAAVSVLTEPDGFHGSLEDLAAVATLGVPTLRKDFLVDPSQVWEARAVGASAVLLIVAGLDDAALAALAEEARVARLDVLFEVHDEQELHRLLPLSPRLVGVNARDLRDFRLDRDLFARLAGMRPVGALMVAESGVRDADDVERMGEQGADAVLVGETLVTAADPTAATAALVEAGRSAGRVE
jgi:indole-3-glycerol phosphate synthase